MRKIFYYEYSLKVKSISLGLYSTCNLLQVIQVEKLFAVECLNQQINTEVNLKYIYYCK